MEMFFTVSGCLRGLGLFGVSLYVEALRRVAGILCQLGLQISHELSGVGSISRLEGLCMLCCRCRRRRDNSGIRF